MIGNKFLVSIAIATFFVGCTVKEEVIKYDDKKVEQTKNLQVLKQQKEIITPLVVKKEKLSKNQKEFLEILKNDKYSSLCGSVNKFEQLKVIDDNDEKTKLIEELFVDYTKNLANSCIDIESFKRKISQRKYKDMNQDYEVYETNIDKTKLLEKFRDENNNVESILGTYVPKYPSFSSLLRF